MAKAVQRAELWSSPNSQSEAEISLIFQQTPLFEWLCLPFLFDTQNQF